VDNGPTVNSLTAAPRLSFPQASFFPLGWRGRFGTVVDMAKSRALTRFAPRPIIVRMPSRARRAGARVVHVARRGGRALARGGRRALPTFAVGFGGLAVGYLDGKGFLDKLPSIGGSKMVTIGLAGYLATRFVRHPQIRAAGLAALAAAAYDYGRKQAGGGGASGWGEDVAGDDETV